jgi:hypothetical protein
MDFEIEQHGMAAGSGATRAAAEMMPFDCEPTGNLGM